MSCRRTKGVSRVLVLAGLLFFGATLLLAGCATQPQALDPAVTDPQLIVEPTSISLGVATLAGTDIVFKGSGFRPEDTVFVTLYGPEDTELAVADGVVGADGTFSAQVGLLSKVVGILRAGIVQSFDEEGNPVQYMHLTEPTIPAGLYTARAYSMLTDRYADTELLVRHPSGVDNLKDWLGGKLGKIKDER